MLVDLRGRVGQGIAAGRTLDQIKAERLADRYGPPDGFISPDSLIETTAAACAPRRKPHPIKTGCRSSERGLGRRPTTLL
jgi:hypothetical protein